MNKVKVGIIERFCMYLGRHHIVSDFLDYFSQFLFTPSQLAFSGLGGMPISLKKKANDSDILGHKGQILMSRPPGGSDNFHGNARTTPSHKHGYDDEPTRGFWEWLFGDGVAHDRLKNRDKASQKHSPAPCSDVKYRGMHGRPCLFAGGTDNMCPKGSVSGWWWSYEVPVIGRV